MDHNLLLRQANDSIRNGDLSTAREAISQILREKPNDANAWFLASYLTDNPAKQMQAVDRALAGNPNHAQSLIRRDRIRDRLEETAPPPVLVPQNVLKELDNSPAAKASVVTELEEKTTSAAVLGLEWFVASLIGWIICWGMLGFFGDIADLPVKSILPFVLIVGPIAIAQWLVFRDAFDAGFGGLVANFIAWTAGIGTFLIWTFGFLVYLIEKDIRPSHEHMGTIALGAFFAGFFAGVLQWINFSPYVRRAWLWPFVNAAGFALHGMAFIYASVFLASRDMSPITGMLLAGLAGGVAYGLITAPMFILFVGWRKPPFVVSEARLAIFQQRARMWGQAALFCLFLVFASMCIARLNIESTLVLILVDCVLGWIWLHYRIKAQKAIPETA